MVEPPARVPQRLLALDNLVFQLLELGYWCILTASYTFPHIAWSMLAMRSINTASRIAILCLSIFIAPSLCLASNLCIKKSIKANSKGVVSFSKGIVRVPGNCPKGMVSIFSTADLAAEIGPGPQGEDGQLKIYGDGSAGDVTVSSNASLKDIAPTGNYQFQNLDVRSGAILIVPTGTNIRCQKSCSVNGTILVDIGAGVGTFLPADTTPVGSARDSARAGLKSDSTFIAQPGAGGIGLGQDAAAALTRLPLYGGGAGSSSLYGYKMSGGGTFTMLAGETISITGNIGANGATASFGIPTTSGGGGGMIAIGARLSLTFSGQIFAKGGNGYNALATAYGAGGGGGGGLVRLISPNLNATGLADVSGGMGGTAGTASGATRWGGAGGGASVGNGGAGGEVTNAPFNEMKAGQAGKPGVFIKTLADPTALF